MHFLSLVYHCTLFLSFRRWLKLDRETSEVETDFVVRSSVTFTRSSKEDEKSCFLSGLLLFFLSLKKRDAHPFLTGWRVVFLFFNPIEQYSRRAGTKKIEKDQEGQTTKMHKRRGRKESNINSRCMDNILCYAKYMFASEMISCLCSLFLFWQDWQSFSLTSLFPVCQIVSLPRIQCRKKKSPVAYKWANVSTTQIRNA